MPLPAFLIARLIASAVQEVVSDLATKMAARAAMAEAMRTTASFFKSVKMDAKFKWHPGFQAKWDRRLNSAQVWLDNEILKDSDPYVPLRTGTLRNSGTLGTRIGAGQIQYIAPYARRQYYLGRLPGESKTGPLKGRYWFERSKAVNKGKWVRGVKQIMKKR